MKSLEVNVAENLLKIKAVFLRPNEPFTWASGIKSPIYCDNRLTLSYVDTRNVVEEGLVDLIKELNLISVTPGIRFASDSKDDQKRVATPDYAKELGSTYIVVGRAITGATDPVAAYKRCVKEFC